MKMGEERRESGSCQEGAGAARAEEWLRAEEGALELDFLSSGGDGICAAVSKETPAVLPLEY